MTGTTGWDEWPIQVHVSVRWEVVLAGGRELYRDPGAVMRYLRERYQGPALYRWLVDDPQGCEVYVGETEDLPRRLGQYLRPGRRQRTNQRVKAWLEDRLAAGIPVSFQRAVIVENSFALGAGGNLALWDVPLYDPCWRRAMEQLLLVAHQRLGFRIFNPGAR